MSEGEERKMKEGQSAFSRLVGTKETRKLRAKHKAGRSIWLGFGAFGVIGWSVAVPTLAGVALGLWLDHRHAGRHSWTLTLLIVGLAIGCWIAWRWVARESKEIQKE